MFWSNIEKPLLSWSVFSGLHHVLQSVCWFLHWLFHMTAMLVKVPEWLQRTGLRLVGVWCIALLPTGPYFAQEVCTKGHIKEMIHLTVCRCGALSVSKWVRFLLEHMSVETQDIWINQINHEFLGGCLLDRVQHVVTPAAPTAPNLRCY